jgi:hypothetical protein
MSKRIIFGGSYLSIDPDAQAFITAAGITNSTEITAINNLVVALKFNSLWAKLKAMYPFVGGTASSHKFNLKNPADTNAAFRLVFFGGWAHTATGAKPNGINAYANTFFNLSTQTTASNVSAGAYSRDNSINNGSLFGAAQDGVFNGLQIAPKLTDNNTYFNANNYILDGNGNFVTDTRGLFVVSKTGATQTQLFRNGSLIRTASPTTLNTAINFSVVIAARSRSGFIESFDSRENAFQFFGDTLTAGEISTLYTIIQNFQTILGRQV